MPAGFIIDAYSGRSRYVIAAVGTEPRGLVALIRWRADIAAFQQRPGAAGSPGALDELGEHPARVVLLTALFRLQRRLCQPVERWRADSRNRFPISM